MTEYLKDLEIVGVISGLSTAKATIKNRPSHTLLYKIDGESIYYLRGKEIMLSAGTLLYIPENENYAFRKVSEGDSRYCLVNFHAKVESNLMPKLFTFPAGENISQLLVQMERNFRMKGMSGQLECTSLFYHLLAILARNEEIPYTTGHQKEQIESAINYLEKHLFDKELKISDLSEICGMSAPTFRRIFISRFGITPKKYIMQQRMLKAKLILESGEYEDIAYISEETGFDDPLYFSKCFKAFYGVSPSFF